MEQSFFRCFNNESNEKKVREKSRECHNEESLNCHLIMSKISEQWFI